MKDPRRLIEVDMIDGASVSLNGTIIRWKLNDQPLNATDLTPLNGHSRGVLTLCQYKQLLSGSADKTIRGSWCHLCRSRSNVCMCVLRGHSDSLTSIILWEHNILSCSEDGTIKMWNPHNGELLSSTREDNRGFVALYRIYNRANMPILVSSSRDNFFRHDNSVRLYNFPSLTEIGSLFSLAVVESIFQMADYFLTRDSSRHVVYWQLADSEGRDDENIRVHRSNTSVGFHLLKHGKCHNTDVKGIAP